jgi:protein-S-isoprenylcysteine O-methyltransferase Ste14
MKSVLIGSVMTLVTAAVLFGCAGRVNLPFFWAWLALSVTATFTIVWRMDPGLLEERRRPGKGGVDRHLRFIAAPLWLAHIALAGLDVGRFQWSGTMPVALQIGGLTMLAATYVLSGWAVGVNRFFSPVVRIQAERGHVLVTTGPYRWLRHPGYAAALIGMPSGGLALGSWLSLVPAGVMLILVVRRTALEDRFLRLNLDGYEAYAHRVRFRLIPGIW